jgi:hypothetical protein
LAETGGYFVAFVMPWYVSTLFETPYEKMFMKTRSLILVVLLMLGMVPANVQAKKMDNSVISAKVAGMTKEQKVQEIAYMQARAKEISEMDFSKLSAEQRKSLRDELKGMKKDAKDIGGGGVYISVGALILIIVLLIILL